MSETTSRQEVVVAGHGGSMAASSQAVGGGRAGDGWSQQPIVVEDLGAAVQNELMQKSSVTEQQSTMSGRQDMNAGTASLLTVTTRTLSPTSNVGPVSAGRSDILAHHHTEYRILLSVFAANKWNAKSLYCYSETEQPETVNNKKADSEGI